MYRLNDTDRVGSVVEELESEEDKEDEGHIWWGEGATEEEEVGRDKENMTNLVKDER